GVGRQRWHPFVDAAADQLVGLADAEGPGADQDLPLARRRHWRVGVVERLRPSGAMHQYRFHPNAPLPLVDFDIFSKISPITKIIATGFFWARIAGFQVAIQSMTTTTLKARKELGKPSAAQ